MDLSKKILDNINGKDIIDAGAMNGDTAYVFHKIFPKSNIYAYEPVNIHIKTMKKMLSAMNKNEAKLIHPINKGLSDREYTAFLSYGEDEQNAHFVTFDKDYESYPHNQLGLIKMDIEGFESSAVKGMEKSIQKYKPVLIIAIYHTPLDFFEMKDKIKQLNPDYRFMIRKNADSHPETDNVLIAY